MDEIVIISRKEKIHIKQVHHVLTILRNAWSMTKFRKCKLRSTISYLDQVIKPQPVVVLQRKVEAICDLKAHTNGTELGLFLNLCSFFWGFMSNWALIAGLLNRKQQKDQPTRSETINEEEQLAPLMVSKSWSPRHCCSGCNKPSRASWRYKLI